VITFNEKPATLSLGAGELSPAMEDKLIGLAEGTHTTFELPAGEAFGERNPDMMQWVARKLMNELGDPHEQYTAGDVVQFPTPDGRAATPAPWCRCARTAPCCSTSTTRWPASP
jgi:FKBP-type peptidyl-prolyl cis-trans isomerase SlpA